MSNIASQQFHLLQHVIRQSQSFLLVAHTRPDPDTIGAVIAVAEHIKQLSERKKVTIVCADPFPSIFTVWLDKYDIQTPQSVDVREYDVVIGCDNIDHGFDYIITAGDSSQITIGIDHHLDLQVTPDIALVDSSASSTCEILYDFFSVIDAPISTNIATALIIGILGDTRLFHNPNTSVHVIESITYLIDCGVDLSHIISHYFSAQSESMLQLWGKALYNAQKIADTDIVVTAITGDDLADISMSSTDLKEGIKEIASLLCTVIDASFAMILVQLDANVVKGSLRTEEGRGVDMAHIASLFGGGGHRLASGFEVAGQLEQSPQGWCIK